MKIVTITNITNYFFQAQKIISLQIKKFIEGVRNNTNNIFGSEIFHMIDTYLPLLTKTLPKPYYDEIIGISEATELPIGEITIYNVFYEFHSLCTSIVMEDAEGKMYHGRNLDFGLLLGYVNFLLFFILSFHVKKNRFSTDGMSKIKHG